MPGLPIRAAQVLQLRTGLEEAGSVLGLPALTYTDASLAGATVKASQFQQLRDRLQ